MPETKSVGFCKVSARNRWEEIARKAISGQKLNNKLSETYPKELT